jgi:SAM-dependent methyltransferase
VESPRPDPSRDVLTPGEDRGTLDYFDANVPEYSLERLGPTAEFIKANAGSDASLIDVGCGAGNTLEFLARETGVARVAGMDVSTRYLDLTRQRLSCPVLLGSILDRAFVRSIDERFDFAVLAALLHHLIGRTRSESKAHASAAVSNAIELVKPGGYLVIHEPVFSPRLLTGAVFWMKKAVTAVTSRRIELASAWANIGPPIVSYLTTEELVRMVRAQPELDLVSCHVEEAHPPLAIRLLLRHAETTAVARRNGAR